MIEGEGVRRFLLHGNELKIVMTVILLKKSHSKNQEKIFRSQMLCNARSELD
jgi:hypothetical protein